MLQGFSVPLTPQGKSALASPPPWHYSSDCLAIEYWTDPPAIAALLPPGVAPDEKSGGRAFFWFLDWQYTASDDELTDPARYQYREAFVLVEALFEQQAVNYCPFIFVDNDAAIARGALAPVLKRAVDRSFNRVTVDSDQSTSDTVAIIANGLAENTPLETGSRGIRQFAAGVRGDEAAVRRAVSQRRSNGPVEGHVNRLKAIKRQMFGRAGFVLPRARVLRAA